MGIYHAPQLRGAANVAGWFGRVQAGTALISTFVLVAGSRLQNDSSLVVGASGFLRHLETSVDGVSTFAIAGATVAILQPDGTYYSAPITVRSYSGSAALTQELRALWTPVQAGVHRVKWSFTVAGVVIDRVETYFVAWSDVWAVIRRRLRETSASLPDVDLDSEIAVTVQQLVDRFILLQQAGGYAGLTGLDQERFDTAAAYLTAISLRFYRMKTVPIGEISTVKLNQSSFNFTPGQEKGEISIEEQWLKEALLSLGRVTLVQQMYASAAAGFSPFVVSGPTRYKQQQGIIETLMSSILRLLSDRWDNQPGFYYDEGWGQI